MKVRKIPIEIKEFESLEELPLADRQLLEKAQKAIEGSYAPYSEFHVGAAALLEDNSIVTGSNQENAAYPSGLCAERVTLFQAKANFPKLSIKKLAITAHADHFNIDHPITPCGACRQVIAEVQHRQTEKIRILMRGETGGIMIVNGIEHLLPLMFKEENLKRSKTK